MKIRYLLAALVLGVLPVSVARAVDFSITVAPPPLVAYEQPACPVDGYLWTPGYWAYDNDDNDYYWVQGVWVAPPRVGFLWTPGYWGFGSGFYAFHSGYWGPTVGFYGGINYGYGYGGYGYYGGRWDGRAFRYNTAITRVNVNVIHNTYVDRTVIRNQTASRASFNGRGGIVAKADDRQRAAASAKHIEPTTAQTSALKQARTARTPDVRHQTADRTQNQRVTPDARTSNARTSRDSQRVARDTTENPPRGTPRVARDTVSRDNGASRSRDAVVRPPDRNAVVHTSDRASRGRDQVVNPNAGRQRAPQPERQPKAPQPQRDGGKRDGGKRDDKKHE